MGWGRRRRRRRITDPSSTTWARPETASSARLIDHQTPHHARARAFACHIYIGVWSPCYANPAMLSPTHASLATPHRSRRSLARGLQTSSLVVLGNSSVCVCHGILLASLTHWWWLPLPSWFGTSSLQVTLTNEGGALMIPLYTVLNRV
jgi:hypothetical protein